MHALLSLFGTIPQILEIGSPSSLQSDKKDNFKVFLKNKGGEGGIIFFKAESKFMEFINPWGI